MSEATALQDESLPGDNQEAGTDSGAADHQASGGNQPAGEENADKTGSSETDKKPSGHARRVAKATAKLEQELAFWKNAAISGKATTAPAPQAPSAKPKLADYQNIEDFVDARDAWAEQQLINKMAAQSNHTAKVSTYETRVKEAKKTLLDWDEVLEEGADDPVMADTIQFVQESEAGPLITYHLAKNPEEHARLNSMSPFRRVAELGKLEDKLMAQKPAARKSKDVTSAPEKLSDIKGTSALASDPGVAARTGGYAAWKAADTARNNAKKAR